MLSNSYEFSQKGDHYEYRNGANNPLKALVLVFSPKVKTGSSEQHNDVSYEKENALAGTWRTSIESLDRDGPGDQN